MFAVERSRRETCGNVGLRVAQLGLNFTGGRTAASSGRMGARLAVEKSGLGQSRGRAPLKAGNFARLTYGREWVTLKNENNPCAESG